MSIPKSRGAYGDCYEVMERALEDEVGVRVQFEDENAATFFRMRMHTARAIIRKDNCRIYEENDPMWNASMYDKLIARIVTADDGVWLEIKKTDVLPGKIESLSSTPLLDSDEGLFEDPPEEAPEPVVLSATGRVRRV